MAEGVIKLPSNAAIYRDYRSGNLSLSDSGTDLGLSLTLSPGLYIVTLIVNVQLSGATTAYPRMYLTLNGTNYRQYAAIMLGSGATQQQMLITACLDISVETTIKGKGVGTKCSLFEGRSLEALKIE